MSGLTDLNEYLFYEFGFDLEHEPKIAEDWPFALEPTDAPGIFVFQHEGERHFAFDRPSLNFLPAAGMGAADVATQTAGMAWIGERDPIDLQTSYVGYDDIPPARERRAVTEALTGDEPIAEGLYLRATGEYLALAGDTVVGTSVAPTPAPFPEASPWRRLAYVIGEIQCRPDM